MLSRRVSIEFELCDDRFIVCAVGRLHGGIRVQINDVASHCVASHTDGIYFLITPKSG